MKHRNAWLPVAIFTLLAFAGAVSAADDSIALSPREAGQNVVEHGIVAPTGQGSDPMAFVDGAGKRFIAAKVAAGGEKIYLFIDAETGATDQLGPDAAVEAGGTPLAGKEYVMYDGEEGNLLGIDLAERKIYRLGKYPSDGLALGRVDARDGKVYFGIYPSATLLSYDPATHTYTNHGKMLEESWPLYLRPMAVDDAGWVYGGIGMEKMQFVGFNPATGEKKTFIPEANRKRGYTPNLHRGADGKVYARADRYSFGNVLEVYDDGWGWHALSGGEATPVDEPAAPAQEPSDLIYPDGSRVARVSIHDREAAVQDAGSATPRELQFTFNSPGVNIYSMIAGPDGKIYGSTGNPLRVWCFDPATGEMWDKGLSSAGHMNQWVKLGNKLYGAIYSTGALYEFDPAKPFDVKTNPERVHYKVEAFNLYGRPRAVLAHPDGRHILVGGQAARTLRGSGMLIYDTQTGEGDILDRAQLIPDQGLYSMVALPDGQLLVGTSTSAPTGAGDEGAPKSALIYRFDVKTREITGRWNFKTDTQTVQDMLVAPDGLVYGLVEPNRLFVIDPARDAIVHEDAIEGYGTVTGYQAPRCMALGPDGNIYAIFTDAVLQIEPGTRKHEAIARPEDRISAGIVIHDGRVYYACGTRLFSSALNPAQ